jgi:hypothetical protein
MVENELPDVDDSDDEWLSNVTGSGNEWWSNSMELSS